MNERVCRFLATFAKGRYSNSKIEEGPEVVFLILEDAVVASDKQLGLLRNKISALLGSEVMIVRHADRLRDSIVQSLHVLILEATAMDVDVVHIEIVSGRVSSISVVMACHEEELRKEIMKKISKIVDAVSESLGFNAVSVSISAKFSAPLSDVELLQLVLKYSPISLVELCGFVNAEPNLVGIIPQSQISTVLDRLRKKKFVVWQESGNFVPTHTALYLFSSYRSRNSSDVKRALELARKKW